jgi:hypothetical protein
MQSRAYLGRFNFKGGDQQNLSANYPAASVVCMAKTAQEAAMSVLDEPSMILMLRNLALTRRCTDGICGFDHGGVT